MSNLPERYERELVVMGVLLVLVPVLLAETLLLRAGFVALGLVVLGFAVWRPAWTFLPEARVYLRLREETDVFLEQVRALNDVAVEGDRLAVEHQRRRMTDQVDRLVDAAGREK